MRRAIQWCHGLSLHPCKEANMLILSRRPGESVIIEPPAGERIQLGVKGNQVRIGTEAPDDIQIMRDELPERL